MTALHQHGQISAYVPAAADGNSHPSTSYDLRSLPCLKLPVIFAMINCCSSLMRQQCAKSRALASPGSSPVSYASDQHARGR
jgi:hypothetical protein